MQDTLSLPSAVAQAAFAASRESPAPTSRSAPRPWPRRSRRLLPHLIGLQEVFNFTLNGVNSAPPFVDALETLLAALKPRAASSTGSRRW